MVLSGQIPDNWDLLYEIRLNCIKHFARLDSKLFVYTWCYDDDGPGDFEFYEEIEACIYSENSEIIPIFLKCPLDELNRRVEDSLREELGKVSNPADLHKRLRDWNCIPIPRENCITLVTDKKTPNQCALEIIEILKIAR